MRLVRGGHAARDFRNGILLSLGAALPQRARALSALAFDQTLDLRGAGLVNVRIPARMLKLPEDRKSGAPFERTLTSEKLAEALLEYRRSFRPLFDQGPYLFPSMLSPDAAISEWSYRPPHRRSDCAGLRRARFNPSAARQCRDRGQRTSDVGRPRGDRLARASERTDRSAALRSLNWTGLRPGIRRHDRGPAQLGCEIGVVSQRDNSEFISPILANNSSISEGC